MTNDEQTTVSRNSKITIGAAALLIVSAASGAWWISVVVGSLEDQISESVGELTKLVSSNNERISAIETYNETIYRKRFTKDHAEIWWLRSERANPGGTGLIDPKSIFSEMGED